jgi:hypothetical protein
MGAEGLFPLLSPTPFGGFQPPKTAHFDPQKGSKIGSFWGVFDLFLASFKDSGFLAIGCSGGVSEASLIESIWGHMAKGPYGQNPQKGLKKGHFGVFLGCFGVFWAK